MKFDAKNLFSNGVVLALCQLLTLGFLNKPRVWYDKHRSNWKFLYQHYDQMYSKKHKIRDKTYVPQENIRRLEYIRQELHRSQNYLKKILENNPSVKKHFCKYSAYLLEREREQYEIEYACSVCFEPLYIECILLPCMHGKLCPDCTEKVSCCPFCRSTVSGTKQRYHTTLLKMIKS
mgnify:FL=1